MTGHRRTIAVVDPVASGASYGEAGKALGLSVIAVLSQEYTASYVVQTFQPDDYDEIHEHRSIGETVAFLASRQVAAVIPGTQVALDITDLLAGELGLIGNPVESLAARVNKRAMKERWNAHGLPCAAFHESDRVESVVEWAERQGYPVVLKPNASTGASNVFVCTDEREVAKAFAAITSLPDLYDRRFGSVLAEEYLDGDEYFMNLLHNGGRGQLVSAAKYDKLQREGRPSVYRNFRSLPLDDPGVLEALPYIQDLNTAVDVRYGINDTEYKLTSRGPRALEINNRLPGAGTPLMAEKCTGRSWYRDNIQIFLGEYDNAEPHVFHRHYNMCCLINDRAGRVSGFEGLEEVSRLESYDGVRLIAEEGGYWPVTVDLGSAWGLVRLVHEDRAQLERDAEAVHELVRLKVE
ncbi:ATP-grasp domain-containing protein [Nonomuraea sp. NPDC049725]|uniref:ATP-grasp domain-containing protein n=1 Tax=Nonomuraea sp. NPDC049725 TaxID=3154508 RepID=UPI00343C684E